MTDWIDDASGAEVPSAAAIRAEPPPARGGREKKRKESNAIYTPLIPPNGLATVDE